ncbi:WD40-repeat-containing domain protein [Thelephora terrestris]|uniref:WD40-repeat-containing domain protein n=1 Tax=Thelephora terrestris TaxID=56493 RepID=A0A9P6L0M0_9AGAM|nr:WD40-repeat-containing domain protein [Thelephora terrestris]
MSNFDSIHDSPTRLYRYILPFCPATSWLHKWYTPESLQEVRVVKGHLDKWGTCTRVVSFPHHATALTHQKDIIAVGLDTGDIIILDGFTGSSRLVLSEHVKRVGCLAFSLDGTILVSGSEDNTTKVWDVQTGGVVKTFHDRAHSVSISLDAVTIASCSLPGIICLWSIRTGECQHCLIISPVPDEVPLVGFLHTAPGHFMYMCHGVIKQWDTIKCCHTGPTIFSQHFSLSSDGKHFISCGKTHPTVCETGSGAIITTLPSPGQGFSHCCFSPSDKFVAGVAGKTIYVWDVTGSPHLIETLTPDTSNISSFVYSSSLVSMHDDGKIRFLWIDGGSTHSTTQNTKPTEATWARIIYTTLQEGVVISVDATGTIACWDLSTGLPNTLQIPKVNHPCAAQLVNNILTIVHPISSCPPCWNISMWDIKAGKMLQEKSLYGGLNDVPSDIGISEDGTMFFVVYLDEIQTWSISTEKIIGSLLIYEHIQTSAPFYVNLDGPILWIHFLSELQAWGWDLRDPGSPLLNSLNTVPYKFHLAFLGASVEDTGYSRIVDTTSRTEVFRLPEPFARPRAIEWNGRYLFAISNTEEVLILDFDHIALP